jgi:hypothetical protein
MYPIFFIFDSLRNNVRRFDTTIEAGIPDSLELTRIVGRVSTAEAKIAKYKKVSLVVVGLGLLSVAALRDLHSSGGVTSAEGTPQALSCQYMTVSLVRGKLVTGAQGADPAANVPCTTTMLQTSQLCRAQGTSLDTLKGPGWLQESDAGCKGNEGGCATAGSKIPQT